MDPRPSQSGNADGSARPRTSGRRVVPSTRYGQEFVAFRLPSFDRQAPARQNRTGDRPPDSFFARVPEETSTRAPTAGSEQRQVGSSGATFRAPGRPTAAVDRPENRPDVQERGQTRSGARFAARNSPYFSSLRELLGHHQRLLEPGPVVSTRYVRVGRGSVLQTCVRFRSDHPDIRGALTRVLTDLLQELNSENEGFEVSVTFNAVLSNRNATSFSLFFGQNYGEGSAQSRLGFGRPVIVSSLLHLRRVPTSFDLEDLIRRYSLAFDSSDLVVANIINVVYLVHQYRAGP